jgi:transketolase
VYDATPSDFAFGRAIRLREGSDVTVIANGLLTAAALVAHDRLAEEGVSLRVVDMPTVKPLDEDEVAHAAAETGGIVVAEEHLLHGGLGACVAQAAARLQPAPIEFVALRDTYAESGDAGLLLKKYGLTADDIVAAAHRIVERNAAVGVQAGGAR